MRTYNLIPQQGDHRDFRFALQAAGPLPKTVDLRADCPPIFNQGSLGSCTANAGVAARMMLTHTDTMLSRLFLYYKERELEGTTKSDSGATMRSICKALLQFGVCTESLWPYDIEKFAQTPTITAELNAAWNRIESYRTFDCDPNTNDIGQIRQYLATKHQPVLVGVLVYESFESSATEQTGYIPMPDTKNEQLLGGHALLIVGYDDTQKLFIVRNSWGVKWGASGYGFMPYDFLINKLAFDSWVIQ